MLQWACAQGKRVLFFPDEHLGRNAALKLGIPENEIVVWNQREEDGGFENARALLDGRVILWKGWCSVHLRFTVEQIKAAHERFPGVRVVVHPECRHEVVAAADLSGSTEYISRAVHESPAGAT